MAPRSPRRLAKGQPFASEMPASGQPQAGAPAFRQQNASLVPASRQPFASALAKGQPLAGEAKVTVRLPRCLVECIARAYGEKPATALRLFVLVVFRGTLERVIFPDDCFEPGCIGG